MLYFKTNLGRGQRSAVYVRTAPATAVLPQLVNKTLSRSRQWLNGRCLETLFFRRKLAISDGWNAPG
jgi:hypothetical protein